MQFRAAREMGVPRLYNAVRTTIFDVFGLWMEENVGVEFSDVII